MSTLHKKIANVIKSTLSLPEIESELDKLSAAIDSETDTTRKDWLCAAYQALQWARSPDGFSAPSQHGRQLQPA